MSNLAKRARAAIGLSQRELAGLLGITQPLLSRWERGGKLSAPAQALLTIIEREPEAAARALRSDGDHAQGFAGDGGPPPARRHREGRVAEVDAWGHPTAEGSAEPDLGWEPGEEVGVGEGDFYAPDFGSGEADFDAAEGQL